MTTHTTTPTTPRIGRLKRPVREKCLPDAAYEEETPFFLSIQQHPRLTAEEEQQLPRLIQAAEAERRKPPQEQDPAVLSQGAEARERMVLGNLRLLLAVAREYQPLIAASRAMSLLDLVQEGFFGLEKAVERYNPDKGVKFGTYAVWWIRQAISKALHEYGGGLIRLPLYAAHEQRHLLRVYSQLLEQLNREPTLEELHQATNIPLKQIEALLIASLPAFSLEQTLYEEQDSDICLRDLLASQNESQEEQLARNRRQALLAQWLEEAALTPREQLVLRLRFGLPISAALRQAAATPARTKGGPPPTPFRLGTSPITTQQEHTLQECSDLLGITRERIRQIEQQALEKVRKYLKEQQISLDDLYL